MKPRKPADFAQRLQHRVAPLLAAARIPGAAIAVVVDGETWVAQGYGHRDLETECAVTHETLYPLASTTKALNATVIGMMVEEGELTWDEPVQTYLPTFRLGDAFISSQVTLRDLILMRTGLPGHDWLWLANPGSRADLVARLAHLELSAGFRERFQYNNLTVVVAGHVAEVVAGESWENLIRRKILRPLGMCSTHVVPPTSGNVSSSFHENEDRELVPSPRLATGAAAPAGGALYSTVSDMARWVSFNLSDGELDGRRLIKVQSLAQIHSPQVAVGSDPTAPTPLAAYGLGWYVDSYNGAHRITHGGYLFDLNSEVSLFPEHAVGIVSFVNFGCSGLARLLNQAVFDEIMGLRPAQTVEQKLAQYEMKVTNARERHKAARRVAGTSPSHPLEDYAGVYEDAGYGKVEIRQNSGELVLHRNELVLSLAHWHYDAWTANDRALFPIHADNPFERSSRLLFETNDDGEVCGLLIRLEPAVAPIRFTRRRRATDPGSSGRAAQINS